jgi:hypothetical protein
MTAFLVYLTFHIATANQKEEMQPDKLREHSIESTIISIKANEE